MIKAQFFGSGDFPAGFRISGHSGYAESGSDIICAAVSAMSMLVINTVSDEYGAEVRLDTEECSALIDFEIVSCSHEFSEASGKLLAGFRSELEAIARDYPDNIIVK